MTENRHLWQQMTAPPTLFDAFDKVRKNGGVAGGDGLTIGVYGKSAARRLSALSASLKDGSFTPGPYRKLAIPKPKGGYRTLAIPSLDDRIAHTALAQTLEPVLEAQFEASSFAYRPGKSVQQAVLMVERWRNEGYHHVIEADIVKFFDSVCHDLLARALEDALSDCDGTAALLEFVEEALEHQATELGTPSRGLAQGSPSSPILANLYLDRLDEEIEAKGVKLVRFADDFLILCKREETALRALDKAREVLADLGLDLHEDETGLTDFDKGFDFLGHLFVRGLALKKEQTSARRALPVSAKDNGGETEQKRTRENEVEGFPETRLELRAVDSLGEDDHQDDPRLSVRYDRGPNILYVMEKNRRITLHNQSIAITNMAEKELATIHHKNIERIEIGPDVSIDQAVIEHCMLNNTDLYFVDGWGQQKGRIVGHEEDRPRLQYDQAMLCADEKGALEIARALVDARIRNQRTQLFRLNRRQKLSDVTDTLNRMKYTLRKVTHAQTVAQLRGLEGASGADYWPALGLLSAGAPEPFRRRRPASDPLNATINYFTAMLERDVRSAIHAAGLQPGFGMLHAVRDYSEAGVYDLMEPFRASLTEGLAAYLFNANRLEDTMFESLADGTIRIGKEARKAIIRGYESAVSKRISIHGSKRKLAWRPMMRHQAISLAKAATKNDPSLFQPFLMDV